MNGGLDLAVEQVTGGRTIWRSDIKPAACALIAHHWPADPNLGDITKVDWTRVEPVEILTAGFPCTDVSLAGRRLGMIRTGADSTRSGLWFEVARAIDGLRPPLVVIENVRGLLSAEADSDMEPCPWCLGNDAGIALRALGAVLGDLADLGYDAQWCGLRAADVGAPHGRFRVFIVARPGAAGHADGGGGDGRGSAGLPGEAGPAAGFPAADTADVGHERSGLAWRRRDGSTDRRLTAADTAGIAGSVAHGDDVRPGRDPDERTPSSRRSAAADAGDAGLQGRGAPGVAAEPGCAAAVRDSEPAADAAGDGRHEGWTEPAGLVGGPDAAVSSPVDWGQYGPAIRHWETVLGRRAPAPTLTGPKGGKQLSGQFTEWMMGLPAGHITGVPGLTRNQQLSLAGDGVVPHQAVAALRHLLTD